MTLAEARAWNSAIETMRGIASASADLIEATGRRPLVEAFAVASLRALADDGAALLVRIEMSDVASPVTAAKVATAVSSVPEGAPG